MTMLKLRAATHGDIEPVEDTVEQVVEDLHDEYVPDQTVREPCRKPGGRDYLVNARAEVAEQNEDLSVELPLGSCSTLAG